MLPVNVSMVCLTVTGLRFHIIYFSHAFLRTDAVWHLLFYPHHAQESSRQDPDMPASVPPVAYRLCLVDAICA